MNESPYEPTDVGPAVGGDIPASEADRQHVVTLLVEATNEGLLSADERDRRIGLAQFAETFDDLVPLTRDLVNLDGPVARPAPLSRPSTAQVDTVNASEDADQVVAIFSGSSRAGHWRVRRHTSVLAMFGGAELDTSEAVFESQTVTVNGFCMFGGLTLKVPEGVEVRSQVVGIFGGTDVKVSPPQPGAPLVILKGAAIFGGIEVRNPKQKKRGKN
ncbi:MAG: DUF1707 domain-containing protein [Propionicimonas sp.]